MPRRLALIKRDQLIKRSTPPRLKTHFRMGPCRFWRCMQSGSPIARLSIDWLKLENCREVEAALRFGVRYESRIKRTHPRDTPIRDGLRSRPFPPQRLNFLEKVKHNLDSVQICS